MDGRRVPGCTASCRIQPASASTICCTTGTRACRSILNPMSNQAPKQLFYLWKQLSTGSLQTMYDNIPKTTHSHPLKPIQGLTPGLFKPQKKSPHKTNRKNDQK